jgi:hypothetical protein
MRGKGLGTCARQLVGREDKVTGQGIPDENCQRRQRVEFTDRGLTRLFKTPLRRQERICFIK